MENNFTTTAATPNTSSALTMYSEMSSTIQPITDYFISSNITNSTVPPTPIKYCSTALSTGEFIFLVIGHLAVLLTTISVNSIIIYIICCYRNIKNAFNILIVNMAAADILDALVASPANIAFLFVGNYYPNNVFGEILCRLYPFLQDVAVTTSVLTLTVIAIDRYFAIVHVLRTPMDVRAVRRVVLGIWLSSAILFSYAFFRFKLVSAPDGSHARCYVLWFSLEDDFELAKSLQTADTILKLILHYTLPLVVMVIFYTIILIHLWQTKAPGEMTDKHQRRLETQKRKIIKMLVTIVTVFAVCWFPVHLYHLLLTFNRDLIRCKLPIIAVFSMILFAHTNSAINPCLYLIFNQNFRDGLKHICNKFLKRDPSLMERTSTTRDVISGATAIPNIGYHPSTPQLTRINTSSSCDEIADSRL